MFFSEEEFKESIKKSLYPFVISDLKRENGRWVACARLRFPLETSEAKWVPVSDLLNTLK